MKFIINSEYFRKKILEGIELGARYFVTEGDEIFLLTRTQSVTIKVHSLEQSGERELFDVEKWQRIAHELKKIPEQPITIELCYNRIEIYCVMVLPVTDQA